MSLQGPLDNPKDEPGWEIYPPPPEPSWDHWSVRKNVGESQEIVAPLTATRSRKPGYDIGTDFSFEDCLPLPGKSDMNFRLDKSSVFQVYETSSSADLDTPILHIPTLREFYMDLDTIISASSDGPSKSYAFRRLQYLEGKFGLYVLLNEYQEMADSKKVPHRGKGNSKLFET